jgi:ATP-binding cassette, subfamily B, bacterial
LSRRKSRMSASATDSLPEMEIPGWYVHAEEIAETGFIRMLRRLPYLVRRALRLAWQASPALTLLTLGLNIASGAALTFGLVAIRDAANALFTVGPS